MKFFNAVVQRDSELFRHKNNGNQIKEQHRRMKSRRAHLKWMMSRSRRHSYVLCFQKILAVSNRLYEQKNCIEQERHHNKKNFLFGGKIWPALRSGEIGQ